VADLLEMQARLMLLEGRLDDMEVELQNRVAQTDDPFDVEDFGYQGPFRVAAKAAGGLVLTVSRGLVYAGTEAEWDFPSSAGPAQTAEVTPGGDGEWLVVMAISVDSEFGFFTATAPDYPEISCVARNTFAMLNEVGTCHAILAEVDVVDGALARVEQHQFGDIYCPTFYIDDTNGDKVWVCAWTDGDLAIQVGNVVGEVDFVRPFATPIQAVLPMNVTSPVNNRPEKNGG
jgi:hypothetical protein